MWKTYRIADVVGGEQRERDTALRQRLHHAVRLHRHVLGLRCVVHLLLLGFGGRHLRLRRLHDGLGTRNCSLQGRGFHDTLRRSLGTRRGVLLALRGAQLRLCNSLRLCAAPVRPVRLAAVGARFAARSLQPLVTAIATVADAVIYHGAGQVFAPIPSVCAVEASVGTGRCAGFVAAVRTIAVIIVHLRYQEGDTSSAWFEC
jgi:hypothetical protein